MAHHQRNSEEKKISCAAAGLAALIFLCLLLAGGAFVLSGKLPSAKSSGQSGSSALRDGHDTGISSDSFSDRVYSWLGIDTILSVLRPEDTDNAGSAAPPAVASAGTTSPATDIETADAPAEKAADLPAEAAGRSENTDRSAKVSEDETRAGAENEEKSRSSARSRKKYVREWEDRHMRDFPENYPLHNYNWKYLRYDENGVLHYEGDEDYTIRRGIDVSEFQGSIDWKKVKKAGYDFVFVRAGYRTMHSGDLQKDSRALKNLRRARKAGLDVGAYFFSQAITTEEAREEARLCLDVIRESGVALTLPIVFDPEIVVEDYYARINFISGKQFTDNSVAFCKTVKKAGYTPAIYANCSTETDILDMSRLKDTVVWYADYGAVPESPYDFTFWQYSNLGRVSGIPDIETDLNVWFIKK